MNAACSSGAIAKKYAVTLNVFCVVYPKLKRLYLNREHSANVS